MPLMSSPFLLVVFAFQLTVSLGPCEQKNKEGEIEPICNIGNWDKTYYNIEKETGNGIGTKGKKRNANISKGFDKTYKFLNSLQMSDGSTSDFTPQKRLHSLVNKRTGRRQTFTRSWSMTG